MKNKKTIGHARFKDGKLVIPSKQKQKEKVFRKKYNEYKNKYYNNKRKYPSKNNNLLDEDNNESLDLNKWKQENQNDWLKLRQKIEEKRKK